MASNVIETTVQAWNDRLMDDHREAMKCWDVQDLVRFCTCTGLQLQDRFERHGIPVEENADFQGICRSLLKLAVKVRSLANEFTGRGFDLRGVDELDSAVVTVRHLLVDLIDAVDPDQSPLPPVTEASAEKTAPGSWYQEDHSKLRDPIA